MLKELTDPCQIFYIGQKTSYSRLYITRDLFEEFLYSYSVFSRIWDFLLPFSFKTQESDIGQAPYRFRQLGPTSLPDMNLGSFGSPIDLCSECLLTGRTECAYGFRHVKLNGRAHMMEGNPDYDPWSVRQTAVYQQYSSTQDKNTFLLIAPSNEARANLEQEVLRLRGGRKRLNPFHLHLILVATLHDNWRLYIRNLEHRLTKQVSGLLLCTVAIINPFTDPE